MFSILFLSLIYGCFCQRTPTISVISPPQSKDIGSTVDLSCSVQYVQNYPVLWTKVDPERSMEPVILSTGTTTIVRDSRFSLRYDTASSTYTLQIKDIQQTDGGFYKCQIIISLSNKISAEVELLVKRPPSVFDNSTRTVKASEGQEITLECYAGGNPLPRISWRRENNAILPTGGSVYRGNTLKIGSIRKEDRGTYYCIAENGVGDPVKRNVAVEVEFAPIVSVSKSRVGQALSYDADLECRIEAFPPASPVWLKNEIQLSNNQHYTITQFSTAGEITDTTIRVTAIEERQYGKYICRATNKFGQAESTIELYETEDRICPPACGPGASFSYNKGYNFTSSIFVIIISFLYLQLTR